MMGLWIWICASKVGRWIAAVAAGIVAVLMFAGWQRREGAKQAEQRQHEVDYAALIQADRADSAYRADGAAQRLRRGDF